MVFTLYFVIFIIWLMGAPGWFVFLAAVLNTFLWIYVSRKVRDARGPVGAHLRAKRRQGRWS